MLRGYYEKAKRILFEPTNFFTNLKKEKDIIEAVKYVGLIYFVYGVFVSILLNGGFLFAGGILGKYGIVTGVISFFVTLIVIPVIGVLFSFFNALILFIWLYIFKGRLGYEKAYQLSVYSTTPSVLFAWIPFVGGLA